MEPLAKLRFQLQDLKATMRGVIGPTNALEEGPAATASVLLRQRFQLQDLKATMRGVIGPTNALEEGPAATASVLLRQKNLWAIRCEDTIPTVIQFSNRTQNFLTALTRKAN